MQFADRVKNMNIEQAFNVLARAKEMERQGVDMIHMEIGDIDYDTPMPIKKAAIKAIRENKTHYLPSQGLLEFRQKIAEEISRTREISVDPSEVVVTPGGKPVIFYTILATINPGDEVITPDPGFPTYESAITFAGGKAVSLPLLGEKHFNFEISELEKIITPKTRLIIVNSPHNPTGGILTRENLLAIAELAKKHDLWVLTDEVYDRLIFDDSTSLTTRGEFESIASLPKMKERTIILNAFTKSFSMSGWRVGYAVCPKEMAQTISNIINISISCTTNFNQWAGIEALNLAEGKLTKMKKDLKKRRDFLVKELNKLPSVSCHSPKGTIYLFPDIRKTGKTSKEVADFLFDKAHIAALAGTAFGKYGEGYIRLSFGMASLPRIKEAIKRTKEIWPQLLD